jgi:excisionase family DNA binding protein
MGGELLSTGQAARLCSVTPDTVLKWIKSGRLPANRTAGGHYRIDRRELRRFRAGSNERTHRYCWEFNAEAKDPPENCEDCLAYRARALRCYELARALEDGHMKATFCEETCEECEYYRLVAHQAANVLFYSPDPAQVEAFSKQSLGAPFNSAVAQSEYEVAATVETFRPDYVVVDGPEEEAKRISEHLLRDPRIRLVRVIVAVDAEDGAAACDRSVFARVTRPVTPDRVEKCIQESKESVW